MKSPRDALTARAMLMWLFMFVKMRDHHTPGWWDYFGEIT